MLENQRKKQNSIRSSSEQEPNETAKPGNGGPSATLPADCLLQYRGQSAVQKSETRLRETGSVRILSRSVDCPHFGAETEQSARLCSALMAGLFGGTPGLSETRESAQK